MGIGLQYEILVPTTPNVGAGIDFTATSPSETIPFDAIFGLRGGPIYYAGNTNVQLGTPCTFSEI